MVPIYQTSTYVQESPGKHKGYDYARSINPTRLAYERCIADLENGQRGFAFASGLAGMATVLELLDSGSHVIASDDLYGGTFRLFERVRSKSANLEFTFLDLSDPSALKKAIRTNTRMVWVETPSNPLLKLIDLQAIGEFTHENKLIAVADNTFASPWIQHPIDLGFDIVVHSATKYLNGHSDVVAGALATARDGQLWSRIRALRGQLGNALGAFDAWLLMRGMRTLDIRVRSQAGTAATLAQRLVGHAAIAQVLYPGLAQHAGHDTALRQMSGGFGGMFSIRVKRGERAAIAVAASVNLWKRATSFGGIESLIEHRASIEGDGSPCPGDLLRLSAGLEDVDELYLDLMQALAAIS